MAAKEISLVQAGIGGNFEFNDELPQFCHQRTYPIMHSA